MKSGLSGAVACLLAFAVSASAQTLRDVPYDALYLTVTDLAQARDWYTTNLGADAGEIPERVAFGQWRGEHPLPTQFVFLDTPTAQPPGASGFIDNIGFSFRDVDSKVRELRAVGAKEVTPVADVPGLWKRAVVEDPWGNRLEIVQDPDLLGLHHVTLVVPDPDASLAWLVRAFGGDRTKLKGQIDAIRYRDLSLFYLFAVKGDRSTSGHGHAIDHLGWGPLDLDKVVNDLKAIGVKFVSDPNPRGYPGCIFVAGGKGNHATNGDISRLTCTQPDQLPHRSVFLETPDGVRVELVQHLEVLSSHSAAADLKRSMLNRVGELSLRSRTIVVRHCRRMTEVRGAGASSCAC